MNRSVLRALGAVAIGSCLASPARAGVVIEIFPPAAFIATAAPVYYEGHAAYWYRDHWYYRERRVWRSYRDEPRFLRERRERHEPERHYYEHRRY